MRRVDRSPTPSVRQLCKWYESQNEQPRSSGPEPVGMDHNARISPVEDIRTKFLHNLQLFEQGQMALAHTGIMFRGSSPSLHQTAQPQLNNVPSSRTALSVDVSQTAFCSEQVSPTRGGSEKTSPQPRRSETEVRASHSPETSSSLSDDSRKMWSQCLGNSPVAADRPKDVTSASHHANNRSHSTRHSNSHQPVIRERKEEPERGGRSRSSKKTPPVLRLWSLQSGLGNRVHTAGVRKTSQCVDTPAVQRHSHVDTQDSVDTTLQMCSQKPVQDCVGTNHQPAQDPVGGTTLQVCPQPSSSSRRRQSVADPQDVLNSQHPKRCHRSCDFTAADNSRPSRMVSTASIQLRKLSLPVSRKRSSSEERRISVIQTSRRFPETLAKPFPMLDEWLSSLVKQARVLPAEDMDCDDEEEPLSARQHQQQQQQQPFGNMCPFSNMCSENSWRYTRKCSSCQQSRLSGKDSGVHRTSEQRDTSVPSSEVGEFSSSRTSKHSEHHPNNGVSGEHPYRRRTSTKDNNSIIMQPKKCERRSSEEKLSPQSSVTGTSSIPIHVTEEDEDSACVQSLSDSASVQLCVPITEDPSPRQHLPLSPCSSLGSYHSAMSSNADSAVDMALPDDESLDADASHMDSATKLKQALLARSHGSSSSSSCQTVMDSSVQAPLPPVTNSALPDTAQPQLDLPSFLISDHSSADCFEDEGTPYLDLGGEVSSGGELEPVGYLPRSPSATSSSSEGSYCSTCWTDSSVSDAELPAKKPERKRKQSSWKKIRSIIRWSPFIQVFKKHRYPWIQLAGHQGNFQAGEAGSVLKKLDSREHQSFQRLMHDRLQPYVPEFRGVVEKSGERYIQLQDLLCEFNSPCVMDIKMGVRTYLEEELIKARKKPTLRKDMYQKMVDVDTNAPTSEEHQQRAVTKPRYMQWRDQMSSSVNLGFRIEGIKKSDGASSKDFKKIKTRDSVADILKAFIGDDEIIMAKYLQRLRDIVATQESSEFFQSHEVVGSSLLFVHDSQGMVNVWMIDFGKTEPLPKGTTINHRATWVEGNHEDGYLFGLDNIISILEELQASSVA